MADVKRFERIAEMADRFIRNVESGCSLRHDRFFSPLTTQLLQGNELCYQMVQASRTQHLLVSAERSEEHGVVAALRFRSYDFDDTAPPAKCFDIMLLLRLSESTNIVGIAIQCLRSLGPQFKSVSQVAIGELSQLPTQDVSHLSGIVNPDMISELYFFRPDPLCCEANVQRSCGDNVIPSELSYRYPEQLIWMEFDCKVSAFDQYDVQRAADQAETKIVKGWPFLEVNASFSPHFSEGGKSGKIRMWQTIGEQKDMDGTISVEQMGEMVLTNAITFFIRQPELTEYQLFWTSPHGASNITVRRGQQKVLPEPAPGEDAGVQDPKESSKATTSQQQSDDDSELIACGDGFACLTNPLRTRWFCSARMLSPSEMD